MTNPASVSPDAIAAQANLRAGRRTLWLGLIGFGALLAAGVLLWATQSESLFASYLLATIANCF